MHFWKCGGDSHQDTYSLRKKAVKAFLEELKVVLEDEDFDIADNLLIIKSSKDEIEYSTNYTMMDLDYDSSDIVERLKELTVSEYSETLIDKDDDKPPLLFVFGKDINNKRIYIKLKIKGTITKKVLFLSFHYANMIWSSHINKGDGGERRHGNERRQSYKKNQNGMSTL